MVAVVKVGSNAGGSPMIATRSVPPGFPAPAAGDLDAAGVCAAPPLSPPLLSPPPPVSSSPPPQAARKRASAPAPSAAAVPRSAPVDGPVQHLVQFLAFGIVLGGHGTSSSNDNTRAHATNGKQDARHPERMPGWQ